MASEEVGVSSGGAGSRAHHTLQLEERMCWASMKLQEKREMQEAETLSTGLCMSGLLLG